MTKYTMIKKLSSAVVIAAVLLPGSLSARVQQISALENSVSLNTDSGGEWYITEKSVKPARLTRQILDSESFTLPDNFSEVRVPAGYQTEKNDDTIWYLKPVILPNDIDSNLTLKLGWIDDRDRVWFNGSLIGQTGYWDSDDPQAYDRERYYELPAELIREGGLNIILVQVKRYFQHQIGIYHNETAIGRTRDMMRDYYMTMIGQLMLLAAYLTVSFYFLFLFFRRPQEKPNLYFGIFALVLVIYQFLRTQIKHELGFDFFTVKKIEYLMLMLLVPAIMMFIRSYFRLPDKKWVKWLDTLQYSALGLHALMFLLILFTSDIVLWDQLNKHLIQKVAYPLIFGSIITILVIRLLRKDRDAMIISAGFIFLILATILDILSTNGIINIPRTAGYAFFFFIISLAFILANSFVRLHNQVEDLNQNLERKVEKRTEELQQTLEEVQALKKQQDGDYFLTSLLIDPLGKNTVQSDKVKVGTLLEQKKKFSFKKWDKEIGGDINIAHTIQLRDKPFIAFLNGDAMGKSLQGAGGVLVLGSVFHSIIERTRLSSSAAAVFPEKWLKNTFLELQNVFESFNGSMLFSISMGLVDERTGMLYYINAEHPFAVLYRDGRAEFIEDELTFRKLGTPGLNREVSVRTLKLEKDDVLICGSDGRDDLEISSTEGSRVINEDTDLFLQHVEQADGNLETLYGILRKTGKFIDDLSLLRVEYTAEAAVEKPETTDMLQQASSAMKSGRLREGLKQLETVLKKDRGNETALRLQIRAYLKLKDYARSLEAARTYIEHYPKADEYIYIASFAAKKQQLYTLAIDFGERIFLRNPENVKNLFNLVDCYLADNNLHRASILLEKVEALEPENEKTRRLREALLRKENAEKNM